MPSTALTAWWDVRSDPERIEIYTRWTFYLFGCMEPFLAYALLRKVEPGWTVGPLLSLYVAHGALVAVTSRLTLEWACERRERPVWALRTLALATAGLVLLLFGLHAAGSLGPAPVVGSLSAIGVGAGATTLTMTASPGRIAWLSLAAGPVVASVALLAGVSPERAFVILLVTVLVVGCCAGAGRVSVWILTAVHELDEARHVQARLAVAEERLRFSRDLHDVLGRNLSVIALKSELATQLAQRQGGTDGTVMDQMVEVQRLARESQQELREVVRGYRDTGLLNELAGASGVLKSAGIDCEVDADPDDSLPEAVRGALGWVVREGATNVLRHADASRCTIRLRLTASPREAVLTMTNDGVVDARSFRRAGGTGGTGLAGLRERLSALGGTLSASGGNDDVEGAGSGRGTFVLTARLPFETEAVYGR